MLTFVQEGFFRILVVSGEVLSVRKFGAKFLIHGLLLGRFYYLTGNSHVSAKWDKMGLLTDIPVGTVEGFLQGEL